MKSPYYNQIGRHEAGNILVFSLPVWSTEILDTQARKAGRVKNITLTTMKFIIQYYGYGSGDDAFRVIGTWSTGTTQNTAVDIPFQNAYTLDTPAQLKAALITEILAYAVANSITLAASDIVFPDFTAAATQYSSYQALISQSGTSTPSASVGNNDFAGVTFTWARTGAGVYTLTANSAVFTANKTGVFLQSLTNLNANIRGVVTSTTVITFTTAIQSVAVLGLLGLTTTNTDALLSNTLIEVRVYA